MNTKTEHHAHRLIEKMTEAEIEMIRGKDGFLACEEITMSLCHAEAEAEGTDYPSWMGDEGQDVNPGDLMETIYQAVRN